MRLELVKGPLAEAWGMLRAEFWSIYWMMLKIEAVAFAVVAAFVILAAVVTLPLLKGFPLPAIALAALIALAGLFLASVVISAAYNYIDARSGKRRASFSESMRANALPMLGYDIAVALIFALIFAPFMALFFVLYTSGGLGPGAGEVILEFLIRIGLTAVSAVITLFIQFAIFELLISRSGVLESFSRSLRIVRRNMLETIAFSIILWAVESAIAVPFSIIALVLVVIAIFGGISAGLAVVAISALLLVVLLCLMGALTNSVSITAKYKYWMRARKA